MLPHCSHTITSQRVAWCCLLTLLTPRHPRRISASGSLHSQPALWPLLPSPQSAQFLSSPFFLCHLCPEDITILKATTYLSMALTTRINWAPAGNGSGLLPHVGLCKTYLSLSLYSSVLSLTVFILTMSHTLSHTEVASNLLRHLKVRTVIICTVVTALSVSQRR